MAVAGTTVTRMPESRLITEVAFFVLSALDVAVMVMVGGGLGTVAGAVNVTVVGCGFESCPVVASQGFGGEVVVVVPEVTCVVKLQVQVTDVSVAPVTKAVAVKD